MPKLSLAKLERHLYKAADRLRQEGLDAATYKDYIFGILFLKRCSDVFEAEREKLVTRKVEAGMVSEEAEEEYGEDPDFYDGFFVPQRARWSYLQSKLQDATVQFGHVLDTALQALSEANTEGLEHVLDHVQFIRTQSGKRVISDEACKALVRHFSAYRLRNEDFQFSDLLGAAYEFLINMFAESAGKKGGDFYTPRDVVRLIVRVLKPEPGMSIYDPTVGSGGMLIISREYVEQCGGDPTDLRLCGQVNDASAWSICRLNMLLHGVTGADIQLADTLLHPRHKDGGDLERFHRVIANPPFSMNYSTEDMEHKERFRWGWCPTTGKKGDLMFAQHMLAVCREDGQVATVMPHGVLFRGGAEREIRRKWLQEDLIEAVIGLPQNLFYGASIPACVIVMRPNRSGRAANPNKPEARRQRVLFINADAEFFAGRAQNYLRPEHVEKVVSTYERFADVANYAKVVPVAELLSETNDANLNIRRYVDNSPAPEPHDVRAHLLGGVPVREIEARRALFAALGFDPARAFMPRAGDDRYRDFAPALTDRAAIRSLVETDPGVLARAAALREAISAWWREHSALLVELPARRQLNAVRTDLLRSFNTALSPVGVLDHYKLAGVIATWWTETLPDLKTLMENGFAGVIEGWVDAVADALEDEDSAGATIDPFTHKLVRRVMLDYLDQIDAAKADIARLKGEKETFDQSNQPDDLDEEEAAEWNYAKHLETRLKGLKREHRDAFKDLAKAEKAAAKKNADEETTELAASLRAALEPVRQEIKSLEADLAPYERVKTQLAEARARFRALIEQFVGELKARCAVMPEAEKQAVVLELSVSDVHTGSVTATNEKQQFLVTRIERIWDKYNVTLSTIRAQRADVETRLGRALTGMNYA
jgi:type I restriction enzyme M protein